MEGVGSRDDGMIAECALSIVMSFINTGGQRETGSIGDILGARGMLVHLHMFLSLEMHVLFCFFA